MIRKKERMTKLLASGEVIRLKLRDFFSEAAYNLKCKNHVQQTCLCRLSTHFVFPKNSRDEDENSQPKHFRCAYFFFSAPSLTFFFVLFNVLFESVWIRLDVIIVGVVGADEQLGIKFWRLPLILFLLSFLKRLVHRTIEILALKTTSAKCEYGCECLHARAPSFSIYRLLASLFVVIRIYL